MSSLVLAITLGLGIGIIDIIPMIIKKLDTMFILSALFMWIIAGLLNYKMQVFSFPWLNGLACAVLLFIPLSFLIYRLDKEAMPQVVATTIVFGALLGFVSSLLIL